MAEIGNMTSRMSGHREYFEGQTRRGYGIVLIDRVGYGWDCLVDWAIDWAFPGFPGLGSATNMIGVVMSQEDGGACQIRLLEELGCPEYLPSSQRG